ncbi:ABC-type xylose transport system permease subunit [Rhizobium herbae]|uniref:ABC-type xylose transport system permease subunit n=1 Tax=Rhizobium herbae TaxID=508661 RepID=A0ABS4EVR4_9HYPH|nr:ABC-type xylose transport system permease subunit [Rhizobium herbae]
MVVLSPASMLIYAVAIASLLFLALLGAIGAKAGGAHVLKATARVTFWGAFAMALTAGIVSAGIAGIIQTGWLGAVTTNIGAGMELQVIAAAVIGGANLAGGVGTASGALIGAALIEVIRNNLGLLSINAFWQGTFIGSAIVLAVLFDRVRNFRQSE